MGIAGERAAREAPRDPGSALVSRRRRAASAVRCWHGGRLEPACVRSWV